MESNDVVSGTNFDAPIARKRRLRNMQMPASALLDDFSVPVPVAGGQLSRPSSPDRRIEFEHVVSRTLPQLLRMAMRRLRNREDAEDAVQDALLSACRHIADFEGRAQMSSWLMAIAINSVRMQLRRRLKQTMVSIDQVPEDHHQPISELLADPRPTPEQSLEHIQLSRLVTKLTKSLPLSQRTALQLRHADGLSIKEAADVLGVPVGTLKGQLARGRAKLTRRVRGAMRTSKIRTSSCDSAAKRERSSGSLRRRHPLGPLPLLILDVNQQGGCESRMGA
jgi:RNA polymerase sigma-70 factor, ECF subfamily